MEKIVLFGEVMLRLKSSGKSRLFQEPYLESVFGGSEANVAVSLSQFGKNANFVSAFPDNAIGKAAISSLRYYGVEVENVVIEKNQSNPHAPRLGIYYLEDGADVRPSNVIYDRENSSFALTKPEEYDWEKIFEDALWFHFSGVTPALNENTKDCVFFALNEAKKKNITVSLDLNYRKKLWNYGKSAKDVMRKIAEKVDIIIANEQDIQNCLGIDLTCENQGKTQNERYKLLCGEVKKQFSNIKIVAITLRESHTADKNDWSAVLSSESGFFESEKYKIQSIVERVGAGDAFAAGLIYGLTEFSDEKKALDFATAASCLKHTISGDFNLVSLAEVYSLMEGNKSGRIVR